jgi:hypothetical protein
MISWRLIARVFAIAIWLIAVAKALEPLAIRWRVVAGLVQAGVGLLASLDLLAPSLVTQTSAGLLLAALGFIIWILVDIVALRAVNRPSGSA